MAAAPDSTPSLGTPYVASVEIKKQTKIKVTIPAGIDENQTVVLRGEGAPGTKGGPKGDLYITVHICHTGFYIRFKTR